MDTELGRVVDSLPGLVWTSRPDGQADFLNQQWCDYTGFSSSQALGRGWHAAIHPDDIAALLERWGTITASGRPGELEARMRRADGIYRWFQLRANPLCSASGEVTKWCWVNTDNEDRKQAEKLLSGERALLEMVARGDPRQDVLDALCRLVEGAAGGCYCSVVLADPTGTRAEHGAAPSLPATFINAIIGRAINVETGPCGMATYLNEQVISTDLTRETRWTTWCPLALAHGLQSCWSTPITSSNGKALGAFAVYHESPTAPTSLLGELIGQFTHIASIAVARVQNDAALKQSEAFLAEGQRLSSTGSYHWRVATDEITWSEQLHRMFAFDPGVPVTLESIATRFHPDDIGVMRGIVHRARQDGGDFESDFRLRMPDESVKYLHMVAHKQHDHNGLTEYVGALQDVTQRRRADDALASARSELEQVARSMSLGVLTASIAHEVNQPLAGIVTNASTCLRMLAADPPNVAGACETARRTIRDGNRASDVIARLRALFTRGDVAAQSVDLNQVVRDVIALSVVDLQRRGMIVRADLADDLPAAVGDRVQLQQVLLNLLLNAADAMSTVGDRPREVTIRTQSRADESVCVSVADAGMGIEPGSMERIFSPFYSTKSGGMGIGLAISRSIVESHRGRLWATPHPGPGATFEFSIPCRRSDDACAPGVGADENGSDLPAMVRV